MKYTTTEQEVIVLNAVWEMIDGMVNYEMFVKHERVENIVLQFNSSSHQRLFNILLGDFLSQPQKRRSGAPPFDLPEPPTKAHPCDLTYLFYLRRICDAPLLNPNTDLIRGPLFAFADWLEADCCTEKVWLSAIDTELDVRVPRITFLKICGDIGKHNFARLEGNVKKVCRILADNGHPIDEGKGYLVLPEFYEWFHTQLLSYTASSIAEFLNNLRWGIFHYLRLEFVRSFERYGVGPAYRFKPPADCVQPLAVEMHWELMNRVRTEPYFPRFTVDPYLRKASDRLMSRPASTSTREC
jgi:hypothetical protein